MPRAHKKKSYYPNKARKIVAAADQIVAETLKRLEEKPQDGKPLFLILGETHSIAAHILLQLVVLKKLMNLNLKIAVGLEQQHNFLQQEFSGYAKEVYGFLQNELPPIPDPGGTNGLRVLYEHDYADANLAIKLRTRFLLEQGILTSFNDAASGERHLNAQDNLTCLTIETTPGVVKDSRISAVKPEGMHVRNRFMVEHAQEHAAQTGVNIYIQQCGNSHVVGKKPKLPFQQSLGALFMEAGHHIFTVPVFDQNPWEAPEETEAIRLDIQLPGTEFRYDLDPEKAYTNEMAFLRGVLPHTGLDPELCENIEKFEDDCQGEVSRLFEQTLTDIHAKMEMT